RRSGREDAAERALGVVGRARKAATRVAQLSGGGKRRLDFATAVYGRPELLFLDEPTTGLDIRSRDALWETVEQLRADGTTIVLTTHYLEEAQQHADRVGLMHGGTLQPEGTVAAPPPPQAGPRGDRSWAPETFRPQPDRKPRLDRAAASKVQLDGLPAAPTRLDDVCRAVGTDPAVPAPR